MAAVTQPSPGMPAASVMSNGPANLSGQLADPLAGFDPKSVIDAHEALLADYLNQPVRDILARLGISPFSDAARPLGAADAKTPTDMGNQDAVAPPPGGAPDMQAPAGQGSPFDPTTLIQPVTDALGTLGSGQLGDVDPTRMLEGISQAFDSAQQSVGQALSGVGDVWTGDAASAAVTRTSAALADGAQLGGQASAIRASLSAAVASVGQARARLVEIISEFSAKIAAIGPNIIFPWGIAEAIEAASEAITQASEVVADAQGLLGGQAGQVATAGAPVMVTSAPQLGMNMALAPSAVASSGPSLATALGQAIGPMVQIVSGLASPAMEAVGTAVQAGTSAAHTAPPTSAAPADADVGSGGPAGGFGPGGAGATATGGGPRGTMPARLPSPPTLSAVDTTNSGAEERPSATTAAVGMGGAPMMGGGLMGRGARARADSGHNVASFLHTTDQGDDIVGHLGGGAPAVVGETAVNDSPDIELHI